MTNKLESDLVQLVAMDRIEIPISSISGKLKRLKPTHAKAMDFSPYNGNFEGERVYGNVESVDKMKARGMKEAISEFSEEFPRYGLILKGKIEEKRAKRETHLHFGMYDGCRISSEDYMGVMTDLGFTESTARNLYPELMEVSRKLSRKRDECRSILIG